MTDKLLVDKHVAYIQSLDKAQDTLEYWTTEHLRLSGIYWGLIALSILKRRSALDQDKVIPYVLSCQNADGGFGGHTGHDSHLLYTMSALQILAIYDALDRINQDSVVAYVKARQDAETGEISGDEWGERDTRFAFIALAILSFFQRHDEINVDRVVDYIGRSMNYDGGFGSGPGGESHAGQIYTALAALAIARRLDIVDECRLAAWLSSRQMASGGLNGRPQKLEDVCYSWWALSSLEILGGKVHWVDRERLCRFILDAQDPDKGGIADRPGNVADVYHTCFGIAGLALAGYKEIELDQIDPVYCMPVAVVEKMGLRSWMDGVPEHWKNN